MKTSSVGFWRLIRNFRLNSMFFRLFALTMILVIIPIVAISLAVDRLSYRMLSDEITKQAETSLKDAAAVVDSLVERVSYQASDFSQSNDVTQLLYPVKSSANDLSRLIWSVSRDIQWTSYPDALLDSIYVYSRPLDLVINDMGGTPAGYFHDTGWKQTSRAYGVNTTIMARHLPAPFSLPVLTLIQTVGAPNGSDGGAIVINIDMHRLSQLLGPFDKNTILYITNGDGLVLFSPDDSEVGSSYASVPMFNGVKPTGEAVSGTATLNGTNYLVSRTASSVGPQHFIFTDYYPTSRFEASMRKVTSLITLIFILGTLSALIVSIGISLRSYRPIQGLMNHLDKLLPSKLLASEGPADEVKYLASTITRVVNSNRQLETELHRHLLVAERAREVALRSQIRPHFLYNTLEMVTWEAVALTKGDNKVARMLRDLAGLFHLSFDRETRLVPLEVEVENARRYVRILKARYSGKFRVEWSIDESLSSVPVPVLILQPLIENAFYHGIKPLRKCGRIRITARESKHSLTLTVCDDGVGMASDKRSTIEGALADSDSVVTDHVGILNVHQRIQLAFGKLFGLSIDTGKSPGTSVSIHLPIDPSSTARRSPGQAAADSGLSSRPDSE